MLLPLPSPTSFGADEEKLVLHSGIFLVVDLWHWFRKRMEAGSLNEQAKGHDRPDRYAPGEGGLCICKILNMCREEQTRK